MSWGSTRTARSAVTFDPEGLTWAQREGDACVVCHKRWPRPRVRVGRLPDDCAVLACADCADALLPAPLADVVAFPVR
ncbi:hypothetical protein [Nonomuraea pusilla]|uniref:Uncharacterized protein n=1 Tax=Nonomuraea pusilla TaxID=46177 RepID=A0A1H8JTG0_9ACTN|nr:hypothetical protein [Nonomuraea pusilla]SEN83765.1 hypothetical protein SAMN05660976_08429 [Nonomuraea pusilla]